MEEPFSSCCGLYWVRYREARDDLARFARGCGRPPISDKQQAKLAELKGKRKYARDQLQEHQQDPPIEHGHIAKAAAE
jgi:hypothetical protein